jgi:hypothetical protein
MKMINKNETGNLDSIIGEMLDKVSPLDNKKVEDRLLLAARIGDLIAEKGLSKKQFADLMDQEPSVISKWLSGTHNFTQDTLSAISYKLNIPMMEYYREKQAPIVFRSSFGVTGGLRQLPYYGGGPGIVVVYADETHIELTPMAAQSHEWMITSSLIPACTNMQDFISLKTARRGNKHEHPEMKTYQKA